MSEAIRNRLESFIQRGEYLQNQLSAIKSPKTVKDNINRDLVGEAANLFVREVLDLPYGGKARKYSKAYLKQQEEKRIADAERSVEMSYHQWAQNIEGYLSSVSLIKSDLTTFGNSHELVNRIKRAQDAKRLDTKIRGTVSALRTISSKSLILNSDIQDHLAKKKSSAKKEIIIQPDKPFTGQRALTKIIEESQGFLWVMDTYVDVKTLDLLHEAPKGTSIRLLTCNTGGVDKENRFLRACKSLKVERPGFEIRKCDSKLIHDRFILTKDKGWLVGSSLKDIGKKLTMITEMSAKSLKQMRGHFEEIWKKAIIC